MPKKYKSAIALRNAIEDRLIKIAEQEKIGVERLRRHLAFERLLSRIFSYPHSNWILKGGYAMELRLKRARATKDVDLAMSEAMLANMRREDAWDSVCDHLVKALSIDLDDFFSFEIRKQQFAEKLHAYTTLRKGQMGTRIKDLVDMVLLIQVGMDTAKVIEALHMTFNKRNTHHLPPELPLPPQEWLKKFDILISECKLDLSLEDAFKLASSYYSSLKM